MFDYDKWQEILSTIKKNKLRTALTMFGVFWGIFMLILLLGSGTGLENGAKQGFGGFATNSAFLWARKTTMPYEGFQAGRFIKMDNNDAEAIIANVQGIEYLAPRNQLGGFRGGNNVTRNEKTGAFTVQGDYPQFQYIESRNIIEGRWMNELDIEEYRKVCVIGPGVVEVLFEEDEEPIGNYIKINGVFFKVVGIFAVESLQNNGEENRQTIHIPFTTFQKAFNYGDRISWFAITAKEGVKVSTIEEEVKNVLKARHSVHPDDESAFGSFNLQEQFQKFNGLFIGIKVFVWIVGIGTLIAGVIGVSNIMLIIVKERTREIGIRKAIGAKPGSILALILTESVFITLIAGYIGLLLSTLIIEGIGFMIRSNGGTMGTFGPPSIDMNVALGALFTLVFFGALAGLVPARKASRISPIEAIRDE